MKSSGLNLDILKHILKVNKLPNQNYKIRKLRLLCQPTEQSVASINSKKVALQMRVVTFSSRAQSIVHLFSDNPKALLRAFLKTLSTLILSKAEHSIKYLAPISLLFFWPSEEETWKNSIYSILKLWFPFLVLVENYNGITHKKSARFRVPCVYFSALKRIKVISINKSDNRIMMS